MTRHYYVYILSNPNDTSLHIDAGRSLSDLRNTAAFQRPVHIEYYNCLGVAVARSELLKRWPQSWVHALIADKNPDWHDISHQAQRAA